MNFLLTQLLSLVVIYGYPIIFIAELIGSVGVPLPLTAVVLASGSLAAVGTLNFVTLFFIVTATSVLGDVIDYYLGATLGERALSMVARKKPDFRKTWRFEKYYEQWTGISIFLSRWLLPPITSIVSIIAGTSEYPFRYFICIDVAGQLINSAIYLTLGYIFGVNWQSILQFVNSLPGVLLCIIIGSALILLGIKRLMRAKETEV